MIVKNGGVCFGACSITGQNVAIGAITLIDGTANTAAITRQNLYLNEANRNDNQRGVKMRLGLGTTVPTVDDYDLDSRLVDETDINSIITCTTAAIGTTEDGSVVYSYTFVNTGSESYTINEVGLFVSSAGNPSVTALLARKVVPARTVAPGETISFTYEISAFGGG